MTAALYSGNHSRVHSLISGSIPQLRYQVSSVFQSEKLTTVGELETECGHCGSVDRFSHTKPTAAMSNRQPSGHSKSSHGQPGWVG